MATSPTRAQVTVQVEITTTVEVTDTGYLGVTATVEEHIDRARNDARNWEVLIKQGGTEPKRVPAQFHVKAVSIVPEGGE